MGEGGSGPVRRLAAAWEEPSTSTVFMGLSDGTIALRWFIIAGQHGGQELRNIAPSALGGALLHTEHPGHP